MSARSHHERYAMGSLWRTAGVRMAYIVYSGSGRIGFEQTTQESEVIFYGPYLFVRSNTE